VPRVGLSEAILHTRPAAVFLGSDEHTFNNQLLVLMSTSVSFACSWDHPLDAHFKQLVTDERKAAAEHTVSAQRGRMDTNHDGLVSQAEFNDAMGVPGEGPEESTPAAAEETA
jgi:hypothetical protein